MVVFIKWENKFKSYIIFIFFFVLLVDKIFDDFWGWCDNSIFILNDEVYWWIY